MHYWSACSSLVGPRQLNEDAFFADPDLGLFVVADGMGGYEGGAIAARLCVDTIASVYRSQRRHGDLEDRIAAAVRIANAGIRRKQHGALAKMGTTAVLLAVNRRGEGIVAHIGDSRVYRCRHGKVERLTTDHSYVELMRASGMAPQPNMSHVVTRAVGRDDDDPEMRPVTARPGDVFLLCTDGVSDVLPNSAICSILGRAYGPLTAAESIVERALSCGSQDNTTALVVRVD